MIAQPNSNLNPDFNLQLCYISDINFLDIRLYVWKRMDANAIFQQLGFNKLFKIIQVILIEKMKEIAYSN
jgi:hypothetical protein